jgi:hypothetical protein
MKRLNAAYRGGDAAAIRDLVRQWETLPFARGGGGAAAARALEVAVEEARRRLEALRGSDLAQLMERALVAAREGRDLLAELRMETEAALVAARRRLAAMD